MEVIFKRFFYHHHHHHHYHHQKKSDTTQKGVNVTEIEYQTKLTKEKIAEMDQKPEELPNARENLVAIYKLEKEKAT